jgi:hypothetical protein
MLLIKGGWIAPAPISGTFGREAFVITKVGSGGGGGNFVTGLSGFKLFSNYPSCRLKP